MTKRTLGMFIRKWPWLSSILCVVAILLLVAFTMPETLWYKAKMRSLWNTQYRNPLLMYYLNHDDPDMAMWVGDYYYNGGTYDLPRAEASYKKALALDPDIERAHYELARIEFVQGNFAASTQNLNIELQEYPQNLRPLYIRGLVELAEVEPPAAEGDFARFVAWAPTEWAGYNDLAFTFAEEGKYTQSEATIEDALKKVSDANTNPWLWNSLGLAQLNEVHYTQAQESFAKALALAQQITPAQWVEAYPGNDPGAATESINAFQKAIQTNLVNAQSGI